MLGDTHQKRSLWQFAVFVGGRRRAVSFCGFLCRQHPQVLDVCRMTIPWHLEEVVDAQTLQPLRADDQTSPSRQSRHLNCEELHHVTDSFAGRSRGKGDGRTFTKSLLAVL